MTNLNMLESFRTKEELLNYFDVIGQSISEEEIENLKKSYEQAENKSNTLNLHQLDEIAGGLEITFLELNGYQYDSLRAHKENSFHVVTDRFKNGKPLLRWQISLVAIPKFNGRNDITFLDNSTGRQGTNIPVEQFCRENPDLVDLASSLKTANHKNECPEMTDADDAALKALFDAWCESRGL